MYYEINEKTAKQAHEANSFRTFEESRATSGYRSMVDEAKDLADRCKNATDPIQDRDRAVELWNERSGNGGGGDGTS